MRLSDISKLIVLHSPVIHPVLQKEVRERRKMK